MASEAVSLTPFRDLLQIPLRNGLYKPKQFHGRGTKIVNMGELFGHPRLGDVEMRRLELTEQEVEKHRVLKGDMLFARRSLVAEGAGRCCLVVDATEPTVFESSIIRARPDNSKACGEYLYYLFSSPTGRDLMSSIARQMAVSGITGSDLAALEVPIPSMHVQHQVAAVLRCLDDRIDLLRQTNATLEAIAQALFKSWFVDFDPVRAKAEGRKPEGMDAATAALFPSEFEESELGLIPTGWHALTFGELIENSVGGDWGKELADATHDSEVAIIRGTDLPDLRTCASSRVPQRFTTRKKLESRKLIEGDLVVEVSGGSKDQPTGRSLFVTKELLRRFDTPVVPASFCRRFRPASKQIGHLLAQHMDYIYRIGRTWDYQNQSTGIANFQTTHFLKSELLTVPPEHVLLEFGRLVGPIVERTQLREINCLADLRDTLLPRLISGKLRLADAEDLVKDAGE